MAIVRRWWAVTAGIIVTATTELPSAAQTVPTPPVVSSPYAPQKELTSSAEHLLPPAQEPPAQVVVPPPVATTQPVIPKMACPPTGTPGVVSTYGPRPWSSRWHGFWFRHQEKWFGYPGEFEELPLGAMVYAHGRVQVENGDAARMVLYQYDFVPGSERLNTRGKEQLAKMAAFLPETFHPVVIEKTADQPELNQARRQAVLEELAQGPFPVPAERVLIGSPIAYGLRGVEAELVNANLLRQTQSRGTLIGPDQGSQIGSFGGSGLPTNGTTSSPPR